MRYSRTSQTLGAIGPARPPATARAARRPPPCVVVLAFLLLVGLGVAALARPAAAQTLRVGVLQFGTVQWTLDVLEHYRLAAKRGVDVKLVPLGSKNAVSVALQGGAVDVIVSDWIWVSRQRAMGHDYVFAPYSVATGALIVRPDAGIDRLSALRGKRIGVAGGPVDKSWLLLRAYARKTLGVDLADVSEPTYAAPPLLNTLLLRGNLPAVLNFWHYSARLEAAGMRPLVSVEQMLRGLGVDAQVPVLGWVFSEDWAKAHRQTVEAFLAAVDEATQRLAESDAEWARIRPLTKAENDAVFARLRAGYRAGIPRAWGPREIEAARHIYRILASEGGRALVGRSRVLSPGTFWHG